MRYQITITGELDTWTDEAGVRRDAPVFLRGVERVHEGIVPGSVALVSVEAVPEPITIELDGATVQEQLTQVRELLARLEGLVEASRTA